MITKPSSSICFRGKDYSSRVNVIFLVFCLALGSGVKEIVENYADTARAERKLWCTAHRRLTRVGWSDEGENRRSWTSNKNGRDAR